MPIIEYKCPNCENTVEKIFGQNEVIPDKLYNYCDGCCGHMDKIISLPAKRRDMTVVGDNKL